MNSTSLNQIAFNVLNILRGGRSSQSEHLSLEQVKFNIKYYRALFIRRDQQRNMNRSRMFEQDLGDVPMETVNEGELLRRTTKVIPTPIRLKDREAITFVGCDKYTEPIPIIDAHRVIWNQYNKYTSEEVQAFYRDGYVYVVNDITVNNINIRGIFEDPEQVFLFNNEFELYDSNSPFPISMDMLEGITKGLINGELAFLTQTVNDTEIGPTQDK